MNNKAFAAVLSALAMIISVAGCQKEEKTSDTNTENAALPEADIVEGDRLELPEGRFLEGETFNLYHLHNGYEHYYVKEAGQGDLKSEAVIKRNAAVEDRTGVKLNFVKATPPHSQSEGTAKISSLILAGDTTYDAFVHIQHTGMPALINEGMFTDWNELPHIDFDKPWWYSNCIRDINFGDKVFCMTGDYNLQTFAITECLAFNKDMMDELGLEYPYKLVFDMNWTHDEFVKYIQAATKDLNGDGQLTLGDDRFGFGGWQYEQVQALYVGYGGQTIVKDAKGLPKLNIYNEKQVSVIDKMIEVFENEGAFYHGKEFGLEDKMFEEGRLLFNDSFMGFIEGMRNYDINVGFVPYPMMNGEQGEYFSRTANISDLTYLPMTLTEDRYETVGGALEALAYYSNRIVLPVYFDTILTIQSTRDIESEAMIPIIRDSARYMDQQIGFDPCGIVYSGTNTLASHWISARTSYEEKLKAMVSLYTDR